MPRTCVIFGPSRIGKSTWAYASDPELYEFPEQQSGGSFWFENMPANCRTILFDEYYADVKLKLLLKLCDWRPTQLPYKGGYYPTAHIANLQLVVFTSNAHRLEDMLFADGGPTVYNPWSSVKRAQYLAFLARVRESGGFVCNLHPDDGAGGERQPDVLPPLHVFAERSVGGPAGASSRSEESRRRKRQRSDGVGTGGGGGADDGRSSDIDEGETSSAPPSPTSPSYSPFNSPPESPRGTQTIQEA